MKISNVASIVNTKIDASILTAQTYISTECMLPNCGGIEHSSSIPNGKVTSFDKNDILLSNIRPYFKKLWFSTRSGGCSNDVICLRIKNGECLPKYLYYALCTDEFIDTFSASSKGTKMPRGDKNALLTYEIPDRNIEDQLHIVDILGSIDEKTKNNQEKVDLLLKNLRLQFIVRFTKQELTKSTALSYFITETIGGDWGKETAQGNYSERVVCLRGADIPEIASGKNGDPPTRYILPKNLLTKQLAPWEIIVEISGGSPTQSTGRCALITSEMLSNYSTPIICTNFCRAIRCKNPQFAAYVYSLLIAMYNNNLFFNYENGTTGIKNLDLSSILEKEYVYLPSEDELESFYRFTSKTYKQIEQHKAENNKLNELKQLYLKKFFG